MQIVKPNTNGDVKGQLYEQNSLPTSTNGRNNLDNGIYLRANKIIYGARHFAYTVSSDYTNTSLTTPTPATLSQGVVQSTTYKAGTPQYSTLVAGPSLTINWKYTYPLDYVTAEVTLVVPLGFPVSSDNPVRYYHAIDTYLGGSDNGCGVRYVDTNGKQVVGTYPLVSGNCPSSNSLPANLDIVESFRERNDKFDHYCVGFWNTFWSSSSSNACAIGKTASLSDSVTTTYQDTGVAIEYDFTAPGIYTFSYDFVIGSTFVPNYDHLEIRHPGTATLCPVDIQVLACLSSTVPCPSNQLVSTGLLEGSLTVSPSSPTVTATPDANFRVGGEAPIDIVSLTGSSAATYTLGASGLTKAPLSGVKCWNSATNTQSCSFTFTNTPCLNTFECMESGINYAANTRNPIYTKLAGRAFDLDVYALATGGAKATGYASNTNAVKVELVVSDDTKSCLTAVASKTISFASTDAGKKTVSFVGTDIPRAYPNLRCRVTDTNLNKAGCSTDNFSVRPVSFTVNSVLTQPKMQAVQTASINTPSAIATPVFKAGFNPFNLTVSTGEAGYSGTPKFTYENNNQPLSAHPNAPRTGILTGSFPAATSGVSSENGFKYSEVGYFKFKMQQVYDDDFTKVDANGDCDNTNAFNTDGGGVIPKKYGCKIGNLTESDYFGRFIPDHFVETPGTADHFACESFVYYGQHTAVIPSFIVPFKITAQNFSNATTQNYTGEYVSGSVNNYAKLNVNSFDAYHFSSDAPNGAALSASPSTPSFAKSDNAALPAIWDKGVASLSAKLQLSRPSSNTAPQNVVVSTKPVDDDGVTSELATTITTTPGVPFRYGRLAIPPAHGSELLPLSVPIEAQFWNGSAYVRSLGDRCTDIPLQTFVMKTYRGNLNACETELSVATPMNDGVLKMRLSAPRVSGNTPNTGSVDLEINLSAKAAPPLPPEKVCIGAAEINSLDGSLPWFGTADPLGRASFGLYKAPIIYMRENF